MSEEQEPPTFEEQTRAKYEAFIGVDVNGTQGPIAGIPIGYTEQYTIKLTWIGLLRLLLLDRMLFQVEVSLYDVVHLACRPEENSDARG